MLDFLHKPKSFKVITSSILKVIVSSCKCTQTTDSLLVKLESTLGLCPVGISVKKGIVEGQNVAEFVVSGYKANWQ